MSEKDVLKEMKLIEIMLLEMCLKAGVIFIYSNEVNRINISAIYFDYFGIITSAVMAIYKMDFIF